MSLHRNMSTVGHLATRVLSRASTLPMVIRHLSINAKPPHDHPVLVSEADPFGVRTITLNRPKKLNNMDVSMGEAFVDAIKELSEDKYCRAVVLTGAGRAFSAGGDLGFLRDRTVTEHEANRDIMVKYYDRFLNMRQAIRVPIISAINGPAVGAGLCVALATDIRIVASKAKLGFTFASLGIHPGMGCTHFLPKVIGPQLAAKMLLTGELISGQTAKEYGLVVECHEDPAEVLPAALELAREIAQQSPAAVRACTLTLRNQGNVGLKEALVNEAVSQSYNFAHPDLLEGLSAVEEKRTPEFKH